MWSLCHFFFSQEPFVWVIPKFFVTKWQTNSPPPPPKTKKKPLSNDDVTTFLQRDLVSLEMPNNQRFAEGMGPAPTNTPQWMDVAWNGSKIWGRFIHWMASKMGKPGWCVHGWHPGHTSQGVDACIFDTQILEHFWGWSLNWKKVAYLLACTLVLAPCFLFLSLPFLGAFYKVWQGFTEKKGMPMQMIHKKNKITGSLSLLDQDCRTNKSNNY